MFAVHVGDDSPNPSPPPTPPRKEVLILSSENIRVNFVVSEDPADPCVIVIHNDLTERSFTIALNEVAPRAETSNPR